MSRFTAPLVVTPTNNYKAWRILHSGEDGTDPFRLTAFGYDIGEEGSGLRIIVPAGFVTDFASIPWFARWLIKTWGRHTNAAVIHDYLYRGGEVKYTAETIMIRVDAGHLMTPRMTRKGADLVMLEAMEVMRVRPWRKWVIYAGIRIGGWYGWAKNRKNESSAT